MGPLIALACLLCPVQEPVSTTPAAPEMLPPTTAAVVQVAEPVEFLTAIMEHPIHDRAKQDKTLAMLYGSPQMFQARAALAMGELGLGMKWPDAVKTLGGKGITLAFDSASNGGIVIMKSGDADKLPGLIKTVLRLANDQRKKNNQSVIEATEYRGITVYKVDKAAAAILSDSVLITTEPKLGKWVLDAILDKQKATLGADETFKLAETRKDATDSITAFLNLDVVRDTGGMDKLQESTRSNVLVEFLLGGVFETLGDAPFVTAGLRLDDTALRIAARTPHDPASISEQREFYFGPASSGRAPARLPVESAIGTISTYRDISQMWLYAGDLFNQQVNDGFAQAETNLSTFFAGKDFAEEILGEIKPGWQLVFARQDFTGVLPKPAVQMPAFALVGEFRNAEKMNSEMKRTFQSMVGFFNVVGAMEGNPQLEQDMLTEDGVKYLTASFVPTPEQKESTDATIHFNFSPSLALGKNRFAFSSSYSLAKQSMADVAKPIRAAAASAANFDLKLDGATLAGILGDNREQLVSNNMLEDGNTREEAETQIDLLLGIVGWFDSFGATLEPTADQLEFQMELSLRK